MQTVALLNLAGPDGAKAGLALGTVTSVGLLGLYTKRALDTGSFLHYSIYNAAVYVLRGKPGARFLQRCSLQDLSC